jgi:hypothetical protein
MENDVCGERTQPAFVLVTGQLTLFGLGVFLKMGDDVVSELFCLYRGTTTSKQTAQYLILKFA